MDLETKKWLNDEARKRRETDARIGAIIRQKVMRVPPSQRRQLTAEDLSQFCREAEQEFYEKSAAQRAERMRKIDCTAYARLEQELTQAALKASAELTKFYREADTPAYWRERAKQKLAESSLGFAENSKLDAEEVLANAKSRR